MIYFVGCSFTWGAGLEYEYLYNSENWSVDKINKHIPPHFKLETLGYKCDEYRKQKRYPNIVSQKLNRCYEVLNLVNGGSNSNSEYLIRSAPGDDFINTYVVQFTQWHRDTDDDIFLDLSENDVDKKIDEIIDYQITEIVKTCLGSQKEKIDGKWVLKSDTRDVKWYGISWNKDIGDFLYKHYKKNHIPIVVNNNTYTSFDQITECDYHNTQIVDNGGYRICDVLPGVNDAHLSVKGHEILADSIVEKIRESK